MSPISNDDSIGTRLRALRLWRHMTLAEVAGLAGLSAPYLSMAERGLRTIDRRSTVSALAVALRVSETDLTGGPHVSSDQLQSAPHLAIPRFREAFALNAIGEPALQQARPLAEVLQDMGPLQRAHDEADYVLLGRGLPDVLGELYLHAGDPASEPARAARALVEACGWAAWMCHSMRYGDLAQIAARACIDAARVAGDPVSAGKAQFTRIGTGPENWASSLAMAERAASVLGPHASGAAGLQVLGMLTLRCALASAALQDGAATAHWLGRAQELAGMLDDDPASAWEWFSATNVAIWRLALAIERGERGSKVHELVSGINQAKLTVGVRRAGLYLDVGRGLARDSRTRGDAARWLCRAEDAAPQFVRNYGPAREAVAYLLTRATATAGGRELRGMAARMGIPH